MRKIFLTVVILINILTLYAQEGALLLTNYKESREIENQSLSICQDANNVMIFANRRGIMTFDGRSYKFVNMPAVPYVLRYNPVNKRVYAGCDNNYGYLEKDNKGFYKYISISSDSSELGLITRIFFTDTTVCFYGESTISRHDIKTNLLEKRFLARYDMPFSGMIVTPKNTFINVSSKGLFRLDADTLFPVVTGYLLKDQEVLFALPYDNNKVLLGLGNSSLSLFDGLKFYDYEIKDDGYLRQSGLAEGITISDSLYAFSTLDGGAVVVSKKRKSIVKTINYLNGLPDDEILAMGSDNKNGLWLSHQYGLSRADLGLPVGNFSIYPGLRGNLFGSASYNNELYVATSEGVFYLTEVPVYKDVQVLIKKDPGVAGMSLSSSITSSAISAPRLQEPPQTKKRLLSRIFGKKQPVETEKKSGTNVELQIKTEQPGISLIEEPQYVRKTVSRLKSINYVFKKVEGLNEKCKQLISTPYGVLVSTNRGLYSITSHTAKIVVKDQIINFISNRTSDNKYYVASSEGYLCLTNNSGTWSVEIPDKTFIQPLYSITPVSNNILWAGGNSVAYKIMLNKEGSSADYKSYSVRNAFPTKYIVEYLNDTIFLLTESGISYFEQKKDSLLLYKKIARTEDSRLNFIYSQPGVPWFKQDDEWIYLSNHRHIAGTDKALLKIFEEVISISLEDDYIWLVTGDNQLFRLARNRNLSIRPDIDLYIRSISNEAGTYFDQSNIVFSRGDNTVYFDLVAPGYLKQNSTQYQYLLDKTMSDWSKWSFSSTITLMLSPGNYSLRVRSKDIWGNISEPKILKFTIKAPFTQTTLFYLLLLTMVIAFIVLLIRYRESQLQKTNKLLEMKVKERTAKIEAQKEEITSSITYASRIQMAMLPEDSHFVHNFADHFIFFKPRDIVSGDFYWIGETDKYLFFTVADCTGHGVPGAFMSTLGISSLNEIITNYSDLHANTVLDLLREKIINSLHQTGKAGEATDGMDVAFCVLHKKRKILEYSGAYNSLFIFQGGEFKEYRADRMPIGIYYGEKNSFTNYEINIKKGDVIYIFSDGLVDQFGGPDGVKYKVSSLKKLLTNIHTRPMDEQKTIIENEFLKWKGSADQVDDITMIGVRI